MHYQGLNDEEVLRQRQLYGKNTIEGEKQKGIFHQFLDNLKDPIIRILLLAVTLEVLLTLGRCNWIEVFGIVIAILVATTVTTISEHISSVAFQKMREENNNGEVQLIRNGKTATVPVSEIVVGDLVYLKRGECVMADGALISGHIRVDQSALNGEGKEVDKRVGSGGEYSLDNPSKVYRGSIITDGEGILLVERVGGATYYGMVARDVSIETRVSPLKLRLEKLAKIISKIGYILACVVALAYLFRIFVVGENFQIDRTIEAIRNVPYLLTHLLHAFTLMITVIVVAVPEGLPMMITVVLSANMKKMLRDKVLVKKLVGIETAGSCNILFTDKTGTLTTGRLSVERIVTCAGAFRSVSALEKEGKLAGLLRLSAFYNTDAIFDGEKFVMGNGTDRAISQWFYTGEMTSYRVVDKIPFSSEKKYSSVTLLNNTGEKRIFVKGAPELILKQCKRCMTNDGHIIAFDGDGMLETFYHCASLGERVLAVAMQDGTRDNTLIFLSLIILKDKLRADVKTTVKTLKTAGIQIVMLTGDSKPTAIAIARECGIYSDGTHKICIDSSELSKMSDDELLHMLPDIAVIARALPQDKVRLVKIAQSQNLVVGMTGDGINDAPSLKLADIGFAMGAGTDIAKDSSDIVILDNSLSAIAKSVLYGRTIFHSIRKFISFQLSMNLVACGVSLFGLFFGLENPITVTQMLWVNLIMDTLGGLAFASEAPMKHYMKEKPKRREEEILDYSMLGRILLIGSFSLIMCLLFLFSPHVAQKLRIEQFGLVHLCAFYAFFVFQSIMQAICARSERFFVFSGITKNKAFIFIMFVIFVVQMIMVYFGGEVFRTTPLSPAILLYISSISFLLLPFDFLFRCLKKFIRK